ncbi:hypothetical protein BDV96DRAFT_649011 [Lophiotrema nucula]|uniref:Uncharacterized protein n=1 Tax=Lophiotrema nucula TaxID=690887 RepID=A0A6A5Z114_9PLEO|nr:hypothetical protein BDV96DRAFT_649011 [Lophiotrema nucula]
MASSDAEVMSFDKFKEFMTTKSARKMARRYKVNDDLLPDHPWFKVDANFVRAKLKEMSDVCKDLAQDASKGDIMVHDFLDWLATLPDLPTTSTRTVGIVARQGIGKSTTTICKNNLDNIISWHDERKQGFPDEEFTFEAEAKEAISFFRKLYQVKPGDDMIADGIDILSPSEIAHGRTAGLLCAQVEHVYNSITPGTPLELNAMSMLASTMAGLKEKMKSFTGLESECQWRRFIRYTRVGVDAKVVRHGISIMDLPGVDDTTPSIGAAIERERREADHELHLAEYERCKTNSSLLSRLRRSIINHGPEGTTLVITKIDDICNDDSGLWSEVDRILQAKQDTERLSLISKYHHEAMKHKNVESTEKLDESDETDSGSDDDDGELRLLGQYESYLRKEATREVVVVRRREVEQDFAMIFEDLQDGQPISVHAIAPQGYLASLEKKTLEDRPPLTGQETGIPALRGHLMAMRANDDHQALVEYIHGRVSRIERNIERLSGAGDESSDIKAITEQVEIAQATIIESILERETGWMAEQINATNFGVGKYSKLAGADRIKELGAVVEGFANPKLGMSHGFYNSLCQKKGVLNKGSSKAAFWAKNEGLTQIDWNRAMTDVFKKDLTDWKTRMNVVSHRMKNQVAAMVEASTQTIKEHLAKYDFPVGTLRICNALLDVHYKLVESQGTQLRNQYGRVASTAHRSVHQVKKENDQMPTQEWASPTYEKAAHETGAGSYNIVRNGLKASGNDGLMKHLADTVIAASLEQVQGIHAGVFERMRTSFEAFKKEFAQYERPSYTVDDVGQRIRKDLTQKIPEIKQMMRALYEHVPDIRTPANSAVQDTQPLDSQLLDKTAVATATSARTDADDHVRGTKRVKREPET